MSECCSSSRSEAPMSLTLRHSGGGWSSDIYFCLSWKNMPMYFLLCLRIEKEKKRNPKWRAIRRTGWRRLKRKKQVYMYTSFTQKAYQKLFPVAFFQCYFCYTRQNSQNNQTHSKYLLPSIAKFNQLIKENCENCLNDDHSFRNNCFVRKTLTFTLSLRIQGWLLGMPPWSIVVGKYGFIAW